jgi:hypothetical protein
MILYPNQIFFFIQSFIFGSAAGLGFYQIFSISGNQMMTLVFSFTMVILFAFIMYKSKGDENDKNI